MARSRIYEGTRDDVEAVAANLQAGGVRAMALPAPDLASVYPVAGGLERFVVEIDDADDKRAAELLSELSRERRRRVDRMGKEFWRLVAGAVPIPTVGLLLHWWTTDRVTSFDLYVSLGLWILAVVFFYRRALAELRFHHDHLAA